MKAILFRRRKLGRTSCREISRLSQQGIQHVRNDQPFPDDIQMVFRWGCTSNLPIRCKVVNSAEAIHTVADKASFRKLTADAGLAPTTWLDYNNVPVDAQGELLGPLVVRRATHHQGKYLHVCKTLPELVRACQLYEEDYYISEYIPKVAEYRVFVVSGRVVWVANKTPADKDAVAWNVAQGGRFDNVRFGNWPMRVVEAAIESFLLSGLDFGGVDVMVDEAGKAYVLEINSAPSQTSPYRQLCTSKAFDYIVANGTDKLPVEYENGWRGVIHPAILPKQGEIDG